MNTVLIFLLTKDSFHLDHNLFTLLLSICSCTTRPLANFHPQAVGLYTYP